MQFIDGHLTDLAGGDLAVAQGDIFLKYGKFRTKISKSTQHYPFLGSDGDFCPQKKRTKIVATRHVSPIPELKIYRNASATSVLPETRWKG